MAGPSKDASESLSRLNGTLIQRDARLAEWEKATEEDRSACEMGGFDCRIQVHEQRESFLRARGISACRQPDLDKEARCVAAELIRQKDVKEADAYYSAELWCLDQLVTCLKDRASQAQKKSVQAKAQERKAAIEDSERGLGERARKSLAQAKIQYLRATLPPDAENICQGMEPKHACLAAVSATRTQLTDLYEKPEPEYRSAQAEALHDKLTKAEAACHAPELECLIARLPKYGDTSETQRLIDKNYAVLERRQRLVEKLGEASSVYCLKQAVPTNEAQVVQSYVTYVRQPVLFFRMQLHRSFLALHQAQLTCLTDFAKDQ
jgi:hypothetical protein